MSATNPRGTQGSVAVGAVIAILIVGAVATLGYYQFFVAKAPSSTTTTGPGTTPTGVTCPSLACVNVTIPVGAQSQPAGYTPGQTTTYGYAPDTVTVVIGKNNTVFWINNDVAAHTATSDNGAPAPFDSGTAGPLTQQGGTYQFTFTTPGTYHYHCSFHPWMQGTVIVLASTGSGSSSSSSTTST